MKKKSSVLIHVRVQVGTPSYLLWGVVSECLIQQYGSCAVLWWKAPETSLEMLWGPLTVVCHLSHNLELPLFD